MTDGSEVDFPILSRSVDVELTLQDVVDDRLAQVIHYVTVAVLKSQSGEEKSKEGYGTERRDELCVDGENTHLLLVELTTDIGWSISSFTTIILSCERKTKAV